MMFSRFGILTQYTIGLTEHLNPKGKKTIFPVEYRGCGFMFPQTQTNGHWIKDHCHKIRVDRGIRIDLILHYITLSLFPILSRSKIPWSYRVVHPSRWTLPSVGRFGVSQVRRRVCDTPAENSQCFFPVWKSVVQSSGHTKTDWIYYSILQKCYI